MQFDNGESLLGPIGSKPRVEVRTGNWKKNCASILAQVETRQNRGNLMKFGSIRKRLRWTQEVLLDPQANLKMKLRFSPTPRKLSLHQKFSLFSDRPDLDLCGVMERLAALRRLEAMSRKSSPAPYDKNEQTADSDEEMETKEEESDSDSCDDADDRYENEVVESKYEDRYSVMKQKNIGYNSFAAPQPQTFVKNRINTGRY